MSTDLSGETVLVTGASGNIGQSIAQHLGNAGATIVAHCHHNKPAAQVLIRQLGAGSVVQADLSDEQSIAALLDKARPTLLVNNAAAQDVCSLSDMTYGDWQKMMATNLDAVFQLTQRCAGLWAAAGRAGAIVNIASIEGIDPAPDHGHYATSKAGLIMLTRAAAQEFGAAGIRVNAVSPGLIDRKGLQEEWPEGVARWRDRAPLSRLGTAKDVAEAVLFLIGPAAGWISGANLVVDGGMSAQTRW